MQGITCASGGTTLNIDISQFEDTEFAYGMFTSTRDPRLPTEKIGVNGQVTRKGSSPRTNAHRDLRQPGEGSFGNPEAFLSVIEKNIQGRTTLPRRVRVVSDREPGP
jgi:hypothetical protein